MFGSGDSGKKNAYMSLNPFIKQRYEKYTTILNKYKKLVIINVSVKLTGPLNLTSLIEQI